MVEKINTLCDRGGGDIQNLRESGNYDVEKRLGIEIMALNALCNAAKTTALKTTNISESRCGKRIYSRLDKERE